MKQPVFLVSPCQRKRAAHVAPCKSCHDCVGEAHICYRQACGAAEQCRWRAACGLLATSAALYRRALEMADEAENEFRREAHRQLEKIEAELARWSQKATSQNI
jgi:hypothetical protein